MKVRGGERVGYVNEIGSVIFPALSLLVVFVVYRMSKSIVELAVTGTIYRLEFLDDWHLPIGSSWQSA